MFLIKLLTLFSFTNLSVGITYFKNKSHCAARGRLNSRCVSHDFCRKDLGLVCGDGFCGMDCPDGWVRQNSNCYKGFPGHIPFDDALKICANENAKILSAKMREDVLSIKRLLATVNTKMNKIWLSALLSGYLEFEWPDGTKLLSNDSIWGSSNEPNSHYTDEFCVSMIEDGTVHDVLCAGEHNAGVICELNESCGKSSCRCKKNHYFDLKSGKCVMYKTHEECYEYDTECNIEQGLEPSYDGRCICPDGQIWNDIVKKCSKCAFEKKNYNGKCYLIKTAPVAYRDAITTCSHKQMRILSVSKNDGVKLRELIGPYKKYMKNPPKVWVNISELKKYHQPPNEYKHPMYCGGGFHPKLAANHEWFFTDLENQEPYCILYTHDETTRYLTICEDY